MLDQANVNNFVMIIESLKKHFIDILNNSDLDMSYYNHIKEIILIICDKYFPGSWNDLNLLFFRSFEVKIEEIMNDKIHLNLNYLLKLNDLCYSILKQHNKKKLPSTRSKFLQFKQSYLDLCYAYYEKIHIFYNHNLKDLNNAPDILILFLNLIQSLDKLILIIVECSFSINEFHKDEKLLYLIKIILDKTNYLITELESCKVNQLKHIFRKSIYKIIKLLTRIQSAAAILFYRDLEYYVTTLILILEKNYIFDKDIIKVCFFALYKVINTVSYKELIPESVNSKFNCGNNLNNADLYSNLEKKTSFDTNSKKLENGLFYSKTPDKNKSTTKSKTGISILVSPTKFKNYENELNHANELYYICFNDESVKNLIEILITKIPFSEYNKYESESTDSDNMAELEDEIYCNDNFSNNIMSWSSLFKSLLQSILVNFTQISLKYIKDSLNILMQNTLIDQYSNLENKYFFILRSIIYFINIVPIEYKKGTILEYDMIDYKVYFDFLESLITKSDLILKDYIISISRWSEVLISEEVFYKYVDNLYFFLNTSKNNNILLESCLSLKNLINQIDKLLKGSSELNVFIDKKKLETDIKNKINWSQILETVCSVAMNLIPNIKSAETILGLITLFTGLINKCHFQCDGKILNIIQSSKILDIINNMNDDFSQIAFIEMWKTLILSFPSSEILIQFALIFISNCIKVKYTYVC